MLVNITKNPLEFIKFCIVGAVNTGIDLVVFAVLSSWGFSLLMAHSLSYTCGGLNSFLLNRKWTFKQSSHTSGQLSKFLLLNFLTLMITYVLMVGVNKYLAWPMIICKIAAIGAGLGLNFAGNRLWVFKFGSLIEME
ncbi:GtrA-like protein [Desulfosporosinus acididurans]|uniref:GtrA-like protein n=1 Tax=Desulfosporosinus acididurans TaxID=476652 RepID=A0A0J1FKA7_9FIRM|nr:GtrA family protein [Desulfosporosinus acididurans]KLU63857.1 GtrA-like protein [Desulfosporosinus acididurans]